MRVKDVMTTPVVTIRSDTRLGVALDLMVERKLSGLPVVDGDGRLCGILSEGDLLRRVELGTAVGDAHWWSRLFSTTGTADAYCVANGRKVEDVMTRVPVTVDENVRLAEAATLMEKHHVKRLPVTRDGDLVGMLTRADFVKALRHFVAPAYEEPATSDEEITERILRELRSQTWAADGLFEVSVANGRVTLRGRVPRESVSRAAAVAAENVLGVVSVDNGIEVLEAALMPTF